MESREYTECGKWMERGQCRQIANEKTTIGQTVECMCIMIKRRLEKDKTLGV